jgi:hypothetical protein
MKIQLLISLTLLSLSTAFGQQTNDKKHLEKQLKDQIEQIKMRKKASVTDRNFVEPCRYDSILTYDFANAPDSILIGKAYLQYTGNTSVVTNQFSFDETTSSFILTTIDSVHFLEYPDRSDYSKTIEFDDEGNEIIEVEQKFYRDETKLDSVLFFGNEETGTFELLGKTTYIYDVQDRIMTQIEYYTNGADLEPSNKTEFFYIDSNINPDSSITYFYDMGIWEGSTINIYTYDGDNYLEVYSNDFATNEPQFKLVSNEDTLANESLFLSVFWNPDANDYTDTLFNFLTKFDELDRLVSSDNFSNFFFPFRNLSLTNYIGDSDCISYIDNYIEFDPELGLIFSDRTYFYAQGQSSSTSSASNASNLRITPNPSDGTFFVEAPEGELISICDLQGRHLWQGISTGNTRVDLPQYYQGMVLVRVGRVVKKAVIHRG